MLIRPTLKKTVVSLIVGAMVGIAFFVLFYTFKIFGIIISLPKIIAIGVVVAAIVYSVWSLFEEEQD
jgi:glucose uptake protein GlcU